MNPILALILNTGIHYPPNITSARALQSILTELNGVGSGLSAWVDCGVVIVELPDTDETLQVLISDTRADIQANENTLALPIVTLIAFTIIHAIEKLS